MLSFANKTVGRLLTFELKNHFISEAVADAAFPAH
jgi:hypothetical protein